MLLPGLGTAAAARHSKLPTRYLGSWSTAGAPQSRGPPTPKPAKRAGTGSERWEPEVGVKPRAEMKPAVDEMFPEGAGPYVDLDEVRQAEDGAIAGEGGVQGAEPRRSPVSAA